MKVSLAWLQSYFDTPLPEAQVISDALTFHAFEIESIEGDTLDVKVTPNRGHDCLSHRGIAKELSAILNLPLKADPLRAPLPELPESGKVRMLIEDTERVPVGAAAYVKGVKIGPSPAWLKERLEAVGQRSINNVVDATNYVMFDIGMPAHAFDATTFKEGEGIVYGIRTSEKGEKVTLLGGTSVELTGKEAVIMNAAREAVDIGGVKGGALAEMKSDTTDLVLSTSKFASVETRKAAQRFNQRTEAAKRFENEMADDLAVYGIYAVAKLISEVAGGEIVGYGIARARKISPQQVAVSVPQVNATLGTTFGVDDVVDVWKRLDLTHVQEGETFTVTPPFERLDIAIPEDLVEEVGRIIGYDKVSPAELSPFQKHPEINKNFYAAEKVREEFVSKGYSEVLTSVFADKGERQVLNKVGGEKPYLRATLVDGLKEAYEKNNRNKDLLGLTEVKIFEIGTVWGKKDEKILIGTADSQGIQEKPLESASASAYENLPVSTTERYQSFSRYPSIVRDIAIWVPNGTEPVEVLKIVQQHAGDLLVRSEKFDEYKNEKTGKTSYAFRLIFQSFDRTLTDEDANQRMESVYAGVEEKGWEVR
ncbi:hypothetical protein COU18_03820 [Candidatus Kaiserbacteria bacterium CG10_big_fil_rev_8_21_14_0_10_51_14]|uniref:Uncharacterized protein n=1 Tax=Candidatus Kaiserbacteria bacterium CG10_big_fil_rev_8_21_14_0_10_51_14 TaxID=1974610 RepID=A0A2H0UBJ0_9BACT|nr:MAG: hypothetical protein COU18_03820 [Candidatus Kaiserbacteria bacterium CG10_big_fil_rev_8_21_14_0_10_51_14]